MIEFFSNYFSHIDEKLNKIDHSELIKCTQLILRIHDQKGKVIIVGNGGSAAIASHLSVDFTKAGGIRSVNFNEGSLLTCFSNDYGYENWVSNALNFYADTNDMVILISSSGNSKNIVNGAIKAKEMNIPIITFSGFKDTNPLRKLGNINLWVDSNDYNLVETVHQTWCLSIIDYIIKNKMINNK